MSNKYRNALFLVWSSQYFRILVARRVSFSSLWGLPWRNCRSKCLSPLGSWVPFSLRTHETYVQRPRNRGGGHWGQVPLHFLYLGKKCPFSGMKVPCFHRIEVPFLQNLSALFGQCPLTFEVLPRPLPMWKESVNALPKVVGFLRVLRFPPTGNVDRVGWDYLLTGIST